MGFSHVANCINVYCLVGFVLFALVLSPVPYVACDTTYYMTSENSDIGETEV